MSAIGFEDAYEDLKNNLDGALDVEKFDKILEMDSGEDGYEVPRVLVFTFLEQADKTLTSISKATEAKDLPKLAELGQLIAGSSEGLGLVNVTDDCRTIQHYGNHRNRDDSEEPDSEVCLKHIVKAHEALQENLVHAEIELRKFFERFEEKKAFEEM